MQIEQIRRKTPKNKTAENLILLFLFCVSLATVLRVLSWPVLLGITLLICLFLFGSGKEEFLPLRVDYSLLLTFVAFFVFIGNMGRIPIVKELIQRPVYPAPKVTLNPEVKDFYKFTVDDFTIEDYEAGPQIKNIPIAI